MTLQASFDRDHHYDQLLAKHGREIEPVLPPGTRRVSEREQTFRFKLAAFTYDVSDTLPREMFATILDHLKRQDNSGQSLCFNSPLRERLMQDVTQWVATQEAVPQSQAWHDLDTSWQAFLA